MKGKQRNYKIAMGILASTVLLGASQAQRTSTQRARTIARSATRHHGALAPGDADRRPTEPNSCAAIAGTRVPALV